MAGGRPRKYTKKLRKELLKEFEQYIVESDYPSVAEFSTIKMIPKTNFYDWEEFSTLIKICNAKQETWAIRAGIRGEIKPTFPIFILKNHGYTDKQQLDVNQELKIEINTQDGDLDLLGDEDT